jgi:hypothetical protein
MQRRFLLSGLLAALALSAAACSDDFPTLSGDDQLPPGAVPVTREVILPASQFFRALGNFAGYSRASDLSSLVVANRYGGELDAHGLARFAGFPLAVTYRRDGAEQRDTNFTYLASRLVLRVDTAASTPEPVTVQVWQAAQRWERTSATWTTAIDTGAVDSLWREPGGTRGALLAEATFNNDAAAGDTIALTLTGAAVRALSDTLSNGVIVTTSTPGARLDVFEMVLRAAIRPDSASPDTTIIQTVGTSQDRTTIYTPEQPLGGAGFLSVGGVRSARALFELSPDQPVPGCAAGETCEDLELRDVLLNQVELLLRPGPVPGGFGPIGAIPLSLRTVEEPELGAGAPLGPQVLDQDPERQFTRVYGYTPGDSVVALPISTLAATLAVTDSLTRTFALVSELDLTAVPPTFGVAFFQAEPRLRIVYTLPSRRRLP